MFIKRCTRRKNGKPHTYWQLVESYRTPRGPRHRGVVAYLGELDRSERRGWGRLALQLDGKAAAKACCLIQLTVMTLSLNMSKLI